MSFSDFFTSVIGDSENLVVQIMACSTALIFIEAFFKSLFSAVFGLFGGNGS